MGRLLGLWPKLQQVHFIHTGLLIDLAKLSVQYC
jgi:hypothetical protein